MAEKVVYELVDVILAGHGNAIYETARGRVGESHPLRQIDLQFLILHELKNKEILDNVDRLREYWFGSKSEQ